MHTADVLESKRKRVAIANLCGQVLRFPKMFERCVRVVKKCHYLAHLTARNSETCSVSDLPLPGNTVLEQLNGFARRLLGDHRCKIAFCPRDQLIVACLAAALDGLLKVLDCLVSPTLRETDDTYV